MSIKSRSRISDIADRAGVSVATVDRVLNARRSVRPETARRVMAAAESLDYHAKNLLKHRVDALAPARSFGFILQKESKVFYRQLADALLVATEACPDVRGSASIRFVDDLSPVAIADAITEFIGSVDGIALVAIDHPLVSDAIAEAREQGVIVVSLLSHLSSNLVQGHIGIDGRRAGRTAGWAISRCARHAGPVGIMVGSHRYLSHDDREIGFRAYFREHASDFTILDSVTYLDDSAVSYGATLELLSRHPQLAGLYLIGGGVTGTLKALGEEGGGMELAFVCHQLSAQSRQGLIEGSVDLVIDSPLNDLAQGAVKLLTDLTLDRRGEGTHLDVPFRIFVSENIV